MISAKSPKHEIADCFGFRALFSCTLLRRRRHRQRWQGWAAKPCTPPFITSSDVQSIASGIRNFIPSALPCCCIQAEWARGDIVPDRETLTDSPQQATTSILPASVQLELGHSVGSCKYRRSRSRLPTASARKQPRLQPHSNAPSRQEHGKFCASSRPFFCRLKSGSQQPTSRA